ESGERETVTGDRVAYDLFIPRPADGLPAVILTHGFGRNRTYHRENAAALARRGHIVLTPDMSPLLGGAPAQERNIANTVDHMHWLARRARTTGDTLYGALDPARIGLAGHSAGGAVTFEAAAASRDTGVPAAAVCLLDMVPWQRTLGAAAQFPVLPFCSLRSEPGACNRYGSVLGILERLPFITEDIRVAGATHCDPENPSDALCGLACGAADPARQAVYQQLMTCFFSDALQAPPLPGGPACFTGCLADAEAAGAIVRHPTDAPPSVAFVSPAAGDVWAAGSTQTVRWIARGIAGRVTLYASFDGARYRPVARALPNSGAYTLAVDAPPAARVRCALVCLSAPRVYAVSGVFSIR
ncbi:MAG: alpha/beta hydrolase fold domain-containing protein, partial [Lentisphaerae bacterium]|nr:alpha/beta hydrolase fold domain-containing protein [Lentisphaerota bacterium]